MLKVNNMIITLAPHTRFYPKINNRMQIVSFSLCNSHVFTGTTSNYRYSKSKNRGQSVEFRRQFCERILDMSAPTVTVKQGQLRGRIDTDRHGGTYQSYFAIPYAKPPLGDLRFKAPQPPEAWAGVRDATKQSDGCFSKDSVSQSLVGSEDCLVLNVFTRELPEKKTELKPVMFWIHGGAFVSGSSKTEKYGPEFLICEDVVLVTMNYRLGALGFLSMEDPSLGVPGNAGLKDMVMALKWVRDNIDQFSGDPNNVTIFGESAGGSAVHYLMLSPMAENLFHKAIMQSGCALNIWAYGTKCAKELAGHLGCESSDEKEILRVLQAATKEQILEGQYKFDDSFCASEIRPHGPVVETVSSLEPAFLSDTAISIMQAGNYHKVPVLMGYTTREGMIFDIMQKRGNNDNKIKDFEDAVPFSLNYLRGSSESKKVAGMIKDFYFGNEEPNAQNIDKYYQLQTDNFFLRGIYSTAKNTMSTSSSPVYFYRFAVESSLNFYKAFAKIKTKGVCHADDVGYLFKKIITPEIKRGTIEDISINRMTRYWANFARTGNPNPKELDALTDIEWPAARPDSFLFLNIDKNLGVGCDPEYERMEFWDTIYSLNPSTNKL